MKDGFGGSISSSTRQVFRGQTHHMGAQTDFFFFATQIGVHRDCFGCGRTCEACKVRYMRTCRFCRAEYCIVDNEGSSETEVNSMRDRGICGRRLTASSAIGVTRVAGGRESCFECGDP